MNIHLIFVKPLMLNAAFIQRLADRCHFFIPVRGHGYAVLGPPCAIQAPQKATSDARCLYVTDTRLSR